MNSKPLFEYWEDLPTLVLLKCIGFMNRDTRTALKLCSWGQNYLVEKCPIRILRYCSVRITRKSNNETEFELILKFEESQVWAENEWRHNGPMAEINSFIEEKLGDFDEFGTIALFIDDNRGDPGLQLTSRLNYLHSRDVIIVFRAVSSAVECLKQFDPNFSNRLELYDQTSRSEVHNELLALKQVISAKNLKVRCKLDEEVLMKFEADKLISFPDCLFATTVINKYIKKKLLILDQSACSFTLFFEQDPNAAENILRDLTVSNRGDHFIVDSPFPEFQLKLQIIDGKKIGGERILRRGEVEREIETL